MLNPSQSNVLIIASMHRSGSSLTAAILQSVGVHIGRELLSPNVGNIKGHYENLDFYHFHMAVLESQGINAAGWTLQEKIDLEDRFTERAKEIIKKNNLSQIWGWKEPRTTLFLDFWAELLPEAKFIFIYRYPWEVIDSLYRRGDPIFQSQPDMAIKIWLHYNRKILNCYHRFPERCHLASLDNIISATDKYIESISQKLQINLIYRGSNMYEPLLLQKLSLDSYRPSLVAHYFPEAIQMYQELEARAWQPQGEPDFSWLEKINANPYKIWAFQDWVSVRNLERQNHVSENNVDAAELVNLQTQFQQLQTELQQAKLELEQCQHEKNAIFSTLEQSQSQLHQTEGLLEQSQSQLHQTEGLLEQSQSQLHQTQSELQECKNVDAAELVNLQTQFQQLQTELQQAKLELEQCQHEKNAIFSTLEQSQSQLHQTEGLLEQSQSQLHQTQSELQECKEELSESQTIAEQFQEQLHQTHAVLEQSQSKLHETQTELAQTKSQLYQSRWEEERIRFQFNQTQTELANSKSELHQTKAELDETQTEFQQSQLQLDESQSLFRESQLQLDESQSLFRESQLQLDESQSLFRESQSQLYQNKNELKRFYNQLYHLQGELEQSQSQLHQTQGELEQSQSQLHQTQGELEQSQFQLHQTQGELEQSQFQLHQTQGELEQSQFQLHQTQGELEQLKSQFSQNQVELVRTQLKHQYVTTEPQSTTETEYKLLVWDAWYAYHTGGITEMQDILKQSLKCSPFSPTNTVSNWLESFTKFSGDKGQNLNTLALTNLAEWKQLMRLVLTIKPVAVKS